MAVLATLGDPVPGLARLVDAAEQALQADDLGYAAIIATT